MVRVGLIGDRPGAGRAASAEAKLAATRETWLAAWLAARLPSATRLWVSLLLIHLLSVPAAAMSEVGCFGSLPSSWDDGSTYEYQSSSYCSSRCSSYSYMALFNHNECYCGNEDPSSGSSSSSSCDAYCYGYAQEMCGGTDAYLVYALGSVSSSKSGSSTGTSTDTSADASSSTSSTSSSTSDSSTGTDDSGTTTLSSTSSTGATTTAAATSGTDADDDPSVIYSTSIKTVSGSVQYVTTNIVTANSTEDSGSSSGSNSGSSSSKKKTQVGPIVGGVVGGVVGLVLIVLVIIFILRHISRRREDERMEKEYQEAIKPVDYDEHRDNYFASSISDYMHSGDSGITASNMDAGAGAGAVPAGIGAGSAAAAAAASTGPTRNGATAQQHTQDPSRTPPSGIPLSKSQRSMSNPFADSKRASNGSIFDSSDMHLNEQQNKLTIVNPDE